MPKRGSVIVNGLEGLRNLTSARVGLGRSGGSLPTRELLDFQLAHALAIDAVRAPFDTEALAQVLVRLGREVVTVCSAATDRDIYLVRPDLGRRLDDASRDMLQRRAEEREACDVALIVSDGLSALAAQRQSPRLLEALVPLLEHEGLRLGPIAIVHHGRVAVEDEIGAILKAKIAVMLLGERPGLGSPDSLGAYLVYEPKVGNTDANRNCVSNIRPEGLKPALAAETLRYLITEALRRGISGVSLKDERALPAPGSSLHLPEH